MPSYFYHLTFELYPTSNPTERRARDEPAPSNQWLPPKDADIFENLPSHPPREKAVLPPQTGRSPNTTTQKRPAANKATSGVIDCGASRKPPRAEHRNDDFATEGGKRIRSLSTPPSSAAICPQTAVKDWRFGRVSVESFDFKSEEDTDMGAEGENPNAAAFAALELGPTLGGDGSSTRAECMSLPTKNTELGWGVVHFYRGEEILPPGVDFGAPDGADDELSEDSCTTLCIPAVPSFILPSEFLGFVGEKWRGDVTHFRMVMTSRMSRYLVLMKFRDSQKAKEWQKEFNGKVFNSMVAEICHVVFVKSINFDTPSRPREQSEHASGSTAMASYTFKPFPPPTPNLIELPTCPVCLERMDDTNGLMTIPCQHVFHCRCLQSWKGSGCPVCRFTGTAHNDSGGSDKDPFGSAVSNLCAVCDTTDDLWICLVCGRVGCGRYKGGHAKEHWKETSHCFALEIETQHVWDYAGDAWVHRLIRAKGDGQVVEVPSHNSGGPSREEEDLVPSSKVEGMALEYTRMFTSQMESQRVYFEEMVAQAADKAHKASNAAEKAAARADAAEGTLRTVQDKYEQLEEQVALLERDLAREGARATKATELARKLGKEFQDEKQMSKGLADRVTFLKESLKGMEELQRELEEMRELNQDLTANLSFKDSLSQMKDEGLVEQEEIEGATATAGPSKRKKKKK